MKSVKLFENKKLNKVRLLEAKEVKHKDTFFVFAHGMNTKKLEFKLPPKVLKAKDKIKHTIEKALAGDDWYYKIEVGANWSANENIYKGDSAFSTFANITPDNSWDNENLFNYSVTLAKEDLSKVHTSSTASSGLKIKGYMLFFIKNGVFVSFLDSLTEGGIPRTIINNDKTDFEVWLNPMFMGEDLKTLNFKRPKKTGSFDQCLVALEQSIILADKKLKAQI